MVDYDDLGDPSTLASLGRRLSSDWGETDASAWVDFATEATAVSAQARRDGSSFIGERDLVRSQDGPGGVWAPHREVIVNARGIRRRLLASDSRT